MKECALKWYVCMSFWQRPSLDTGLPKHTKTHTLKGDKQTHKTAITILGVINLANGIFVGCFPITNIIPFYR